MRPACEVVAQYVLPAFRSLVATALIEEHNFSQVAAAKELGTTQAAISQYLYSKRGEKILKKLGKVPLVRSKAKEIAKNIATEEFSVIDAMQEFCKLCAALRDNGAICDLHKELMALPKVCTLCQRMMANGGQKSVHKKDLSTKGKSKIKL